MSLLSKINSIGTGAYFPIELTEQSDGTTSWKAISGDIRLINHNLISIFNTQIGELIRNENFGTRLWECLEEPNNQALELLVRNFCRDSIESWEPRIKFLDSNIMRSSTTLKINLNYQLKSDQSVQELNFSYNTTTNNFSL